MLVDRLHLADHLCAQAWCDILDTTHGRGDLFTMQVHPERFDHSGAAVQSVLSRAAALPGTVWSARLDEIAQWWLARDACRIEIGPVADGQMVCVLEGDHRARMRLVAGHSGDVVNREPVRQMTVAADRLPAVGVGRDVPPTVVRLLEEDGFLVTTRPPDECALHLGDVVDASDQIALRRRVLASEHPILAIDRWPDGARSALALTGDIDALTVQDFMHRVRENAHGAPASITDPESS
jgi:hypothetical protein